MIRGRVGEIFEGRGRQRRAALRVGWRSWGRRLTSPCTRSGLTQGEDENQQNRGCAESEGR